MELLFSILFTTALWILSFSILFPILALFYVSKFWRSTWFSFFFTTILGPIYGSKTTSFRKKAFELLKKSLPDNSPNPVEILEIGIGEGRNLSFYPENSKLTALDMNATFEKYFQKNKKKFSHIKYEKSVINEAENMVDIPDSSFDVVVSTYVLCSVKDLESVLKEVKRVLKPGGKYLFLEHVAFPKGDWNYLAQKYIAPLWKIYMDGCILNRNIGESIQQSKFSQIQCERLYVPGLPLVLRSQIMGIAEK